MKRHLPFAAALAFLLAVPATLAARSAWIAQTAPRVRLAVVPVDPRDLFRGDYVILNYRIARLRADEVTMEFTPSAGETFYVRIESDGRASRVSRDPGVEGVWLRGTSRGGDASGFTARYGIEKYFVPEGEGWRLESFIRNGSVEAEVAVGKDGVATLTRLLVNGSEWKR